MHEVPGCSASIGGPGAHPRVRPGRRTDITISSPIPKFSPTPSPGSAQAPPGNFRDLAWDGALWIHGYQKGIYRFENSGMSWVRVADAGEAAGVFAATDRDHAWLSGPIQGNNVVRRTTDGGRTWQPLPWSSSPG